VEGSLDPVRDIEIINAELCLADLEALEKRYDKAKKMSKTSDKKILFELEFIEKIKEKLNRAEMLGTEGYSEDEKILLNEYKLLTNKKVMFVANIAEDEIKSVDDNKDYLKIKEYAHKTNGQVVWISSKIEEELAQLDGDEKQEFLEEIGLNQPGLDKVIQKSYKLLELVTFFTCGPKETHAWTINQGTSGPGAAGKIHSDFEKGFIRAEVMAYYDLYKAGGSEKKVKEAGRLRTEGRDYVVHDGDILNILFNV